MNGETVRLTVSIQNLAGICFKCVPQIWMHFKFHKIVTQFEWDLTFGCLSTEYHTRDA